MLDSICDFKKDDNAVERDDVYITTKRGNRRIWQTTNGWNLLILWKDGIEQWIPLKLMEEYNPVKVAGFACVRNMDKEPAFLWWVAYTLQNRDHIIVAFNTRVKNASHKYGVEVSLTLNEAYAIDGCDGNIHWCAGINLKVAFDILPDGASLPPT